MEKYGLTLQRAQLSSQVADQLQELIVARSLAPDQRLPAERELAEALGVSRSVVREALRTLAARGLVRVRPGCGTFVCRPTAREAAAPFELLLRLQRDGDLVSRIFEVRRTLEIDIAAKAAIRAQPEDLMALQGFCEQLASAAHMDRYAELDVAFHLALAQATQNSLYGLLLGTITHLLSGTIRTALHSQRAAEQGVARHAQILEAINARDPALARAAMLAHMDEAQQNYALAQKATAETPQIQEP
ncbi:MAG: FadR family transcriptional regulator [Chloroflexi bacterium]|jgi:GntR family transcriptional repressor for pyruvate dehydrogenase complex|nr:FadR family transcriptional regulator [Chloroflexota bacterium]